MKELVLDYGPALLLWAAVAYKFPSMARAWRDSGRRWLWFTLLFLAMAVTVLLPPVYVGIDVAVGRANLSRLLSNSLTLVSGWTVQALLAHLNRAPAQQTVRRTGILLAVAVAVMTGLFLTAPVYQEALDFPQRYATAPYVIEYRLVFLAYLGLAEVTVARLAWQYARVAPHASLRLGLRIVALGGVFGLLYVLDDGTYLSLRRLGFAYPLHDPGTIEQVLVALAVAMGAIGATMPAWGSRVGIPRLCRRVSRYRSLRRLYSFWISLRRSCPEIALLPAPSSLADAWDVRDVDFRLYRRVLEIRDGILALRPYVDPSIVETVVKECRRENLRTDETEAIVEAASVVVGQWAKERGQIKSGASEHVSRPSGGGTDLDREALYLERVAWSYTRSPLIYALRDQLGTHGSTTREVTWTSRKGHHDGTTWPVG